LESTLIQCTLTSIKTFKINLSCYCGHAMNFRAADFKTHYFGIRLNTHHTVLLQDKFDFVRRNGHIKTHRTDLPLSLWGLDGKKAFRGPGNMPQSRKRLTSLILYTAYIWKGKAAKIIVIKKVCKCWFFTSHVAICTL